MQKKISALEKALIKVSRLPHVGDVRQKGFMVGLELVKDNKSKEPYPIDKKTAWQVCNRAKEKGLIIRPLGDVIVLMPPLSISVEELKSLLRITAESISEITG